MKTHQITSHDMTWHLATNHITSPHVTSQPTAVLHRSLQPTTSKQVTTSPPWNGWRLVHSKNSVWASQWLVTLCTFYRQILSLTYSFFLKLPPPACPALLVYIISSFCEILAILQNLSNCTKLRRFRKIAKILQNCEDFAKNWINNCISLYIYSRLCKYIYICIKLYRPNERNIYIYMTKYFFETYMWIYIYKTVRNLVHFWEIFANIESSQRMHAIDCK